MVVKIYLERPGGLVPMLVTEWNIFDSTIPTIPRIGETLYLDDPEVGPFENKNMSTIVENVVWRISDRPKEVRIFVKRY